MTISEFLRLINENKNDLQKLREHQLQLVPFIRLYDDFESISSVTGVDSAYIDDLAFTACVTVDFSSLKVIEENTCQTRLEFPYIPTYFVFREGPPILECIAGLKHSPDLILFNAHGTIHPMRIGAASHLGILLDKPSIGMARNLLHGRISTEPKDKTWKYVIDDNGTRIGASIQAIPRTNPIFISPGHRISLKTSITLITKLIKTEKMPIPLSLAHRLANKIKKDFLDTKPDKNSSN
ncbi:MAG: endonuclease V [Candidatus Helarchaeota archaeon]